MRYVLMSLCIACLTGCVSEPPPRVHHKRELQAHDAKLFQSVFKGDINAAQQAIQSGANINARQWGLCSAMFMTDATPLYGAVVYRHPEVVRWLLEHGADPSIPNCHGETPLDLAKRLALEDIVEILKEDEPSNKRPELTGAPLRESPDAQA